MSNIRFQSFNPLIKTPAIHAVLRFLIRHFFILSSIPTDIDIEQDANTPLNAIL